MFSAPITVETADRRPRYVGRVVPLPFPGSVEVPETQLHLDLRTLLYQLLSTFHGAERVARKAAEVRVQELEELLRSRS